MKRTQTGFTLIELVVTLAILAIVISVAVPSFKSARDTSRIKAAAEAVYAYLQFARSECIKQDRDLFVHVNTGTTWCLGMSNTSGCNCATTGSCVFGPSGNQIENNLLSSNFTDISLASNETNIEFKSRRGMNNTPGTITLTGADSLSVSVVHSSQGRIRLCSSTVRGYPGCN